MAQMVKNLPTVEKTQIWFLGQEDPMKKRMVTHSSVPAWRIPWTEEPGRLQSMGCKEVDITERLTDTDINIPNPAFLWLVTVMWPQGLYTARNSPGQNPGVGSLSLLQRIFPTQGLSPGLPHCQESSPAGPQGKPLWFLRSGFIFYLPLVYFVITFYF